MPEDGPSDTCECGHDVKDHYKESDACQICDDINVCPFFEPEYKE